MKCPEQVLEDVKRYLLNYPFTPPRNQSEVDWQRGAHWIIGQALHILNREDDVQDALGHAEMEARAS